LDLVIGHEMYSFVDGYNGNNQVKLAEEDKENTTFILEWCSYACDVMPFGLCNVLATFQFLKNIETSPCKYSLMNLVCMGIRRTNKVSYQNV
jgi:hypothetical protein